MPILQDDVLELLDAALAADYTRVRRAGGRIAQTLGKDNPDAAKALRTLMRRKGVPLRASGYAEMLPTDAKSRLPLLEEQPAPSVPLFLDRESQATFKAFVDDVRNAEMLTARGISTRLSMLISGPPGTGKTLLAGHIAAKLGKPLYVLRLDSVISSLLGDTSKNIRNVFDFVPTRDGVLFIDEMDAVAKLRDDKHELGELKRVVNTVIQGLDSLDDRAIVLGATNHAQLLDPAIWRRFPYKIELGFPDEAVREDLWSYFLFEDEQPPVSPALLARISNGLSGADIQNVALAARRQAVLDGRDLDVASVALAVVEAVRHGRAFPERYGLSTDQKRALASELVENFQISGADVARLIGVTRQAVSGYLKEDRHGD